MKTVAVPLPSPCDIYHPSIGASTASVDGIPVSVFSSLVVIRLWLLSHFPVQVARGVVFSGSGCVLHLSPIVSCWFLLLPPPRACLRFICWCVCSLLLLLLPFMVHWAIWTMVAFPFQLWPSIVFFVFGCTMAYSPLLLAVFWTHIVYVYIASRLPAHNAFIHCFLYR